MGFLDSIAFGFQVAVSPVNLLVAVAGVVIGTAIGVLPGLGPAATISLLLPISFQLSPVAATILIAAIYYGAMYGGSTTSILVNIPGESASVVTCLDGYPLARQGRAGVALALSAIGSFVGGTVAIFGLMVFAVPLATVALQFGPPEYLILMLLGLTLLIYLTQGSVLKGLVSAGFGLVLSFVGLDLVTGEPRFAHGFPELTDGIGLVPLVMGLFGVGEVLANLEQPIQRWTVQKTKLKDLIPTAADWLASRWAIVRGTLIGFMLGVLPGGGALIASFTAYSIEKKCSRRPDMFGKGAIEGVVAPETANNAASVGAFIPLFVLGIPPNVIMALLLSSLMIHGLQPGPTLLTEHPDVFWGTVASMYIGNVVAIVLNLPMIGLWVQMLRVPYRALFPLILLFTLIGSYSINNNVFDMYVMLIFGVVGYLFRKFQYEPAPLILTFVLGPLMEQALRQSLAMSRGNLAIFVQRPIALAGLILVVFVVVSRMIAYFRGALRWLQYSDT